jgi:hypothetical protein
MKNADRRFNCAMCDEEVVIASDDAKRHVGTYPQCASCAGEMGLVMSTDVRISNLAAFLLLSGLHVLMISLLADELAFGSANRFGWQQIAGLALAGILLLTGAIVRTPVLMAIGLVISLFTFFADWLGFGSSEGFGWQQVTGTCLGVLLVASGWWLFQSRVRTSST